MDERIYELIDKYLRKEMTPEDSLKFEQEALNNPELRKEIELTYRIKRSLIDRQQKLHQTAHWENKKKRKIIFFTTITSIAAMFVAGVFVTKPILETSNTPVNLAASTSVKTSEELKDVSEKAIVTVKRSISEGKEEMAIAEVTKLEEQNVIPTLNDVSGGKFVMNQSMETDDADVLSRDAYELHWLKIKSLIAIGKNKEAAELLKSFVQVNGKYKVLADSLLHAIY